MVSSNIIIFYNLFNANYYHICCTTTVVGTSPDRAYYLPPPVRPVFSTTSPFPAARPSPRLDTQRPVPGPQRDRSQRNSVARLPRPLPVVMTAGMPARLPHVLPMRSLLPAPSSHGSPRLRLMFSSNQEASFLLTYDLSILLYIICTYPMFSYISYCPTTHPTF